MTGAGTELVVVVVDPEQAAVMTNAPKIHALSLTSTAYSPQRLGGLLLDSYSGPV